MSRLVPSSLTAYVTSAGRQPESRQSLQFLFSFSVSRSGRSLGGKRRREAGVSLSEIIPSGLRVSFRICGSRW